MPLFKHAIFCPGCSKFKLVDFSTGLNIVPAMQTVPNILKTVYGKAKDAAEQLGVTPPAVSNWKATGQFPARLAAQIVTHARERGVELDIEDIPLTPQLKSDA